MTCSRPFDHYEIGLRDAWKEHEDELGLPFYTHEQFRTIAKTSNLFLCGRRGSGKSAVAIHLQESRRWQACRILRDAQDDGDYDRYFDIADDLMQGPAPKREGVYKEIFSLLWEYALLVTVFQVVYSEAKALEVNDAPDFGLLAEFLRDRDLIDKPIGEVLDDAFQAALPLSYARSDRSYWRELKANLRKAAHSDDVRLCKDALPAMLGSKRLLVVIDTLDSYRIYDDASRESLRGLVDVVRNLRSGQSQVSRNVDIRLFIPSEVFHDVFTATPAKILDDVVFLRWTTTDLIVMLTLRHFAMLCKMRDDWKSTLDDEWFTTLGRILIPYSGYDPEKGGDELRELYWYENNFLPRTIVNRMSRKEDTLNYFIRHSQKKPRDLIALFNSSLRCCYNAHELPFLTQQHVVDGIHHDLTLTGIVSDAIDPYKGFVDDFRNLLQDTFAASSRFMTGAELDEKMKLFFRNMRKSRIDVDARGRVSMNDSRAYAKLLLRGGVVGLELARHEPLGLVRASFEYQIEGRLPHNDNLAYCMHPAFGDWLGLSVGSRDPYVYPVEDAEWQREIEQGRTG